MRGALRFAYREQGGGMSERMATNDFWRQKIATSESREGASPSVPIITNSKLSFQGQKNYHHSSRWQPLAAVGSRGRNILEQKVRNCSAAAAATAAAAAATAAASAAAAASVAASAGGSWRPPRSHCRCCNDTTADAAAAAATNKKQK